MSQYANSESVQSYDHLQDVVEKFPDEVIKELLPEEYAQISNERAKQKEKRDSKLLQNEVNILDSLRKREQSSVVAMDDARARESQMMEHHEYQSVHQSESRMRREQIDSTMQKGGLNDSQVFNDSEIDPR